MHYLFVSGGLYVAWELVSWLAGAAQIRQERGNLVVIRLQKVRHVDHLMV